MYVSLNLQCTNTLFIKIINNSNDIMKQSKYDNTTCFDKIIFQYYIAIF